MPISVIMRLILSPRRRRHAAATPPPMPLIHFDIAEIFAIFTILRFAMTSCRHFRDCFMPPMRAASRRQQLPFSSRCHLMPAVDMTPFFAAVDAICHSIFIRRFSALSDDAAATYFLVQLSAFDAADLLPIRFQLFDSIRAMPPIRLLSIYFVMRHFFATLFALILFRLLIGFDIIAFR